MHASNFSTLRICNSAYIESAAIKLSSRTFLLFYLSDGKFQPNSLLANKVMLLQIW